MSHLHFISLRGDFMYSEVLITISLDLSYAFEQQERTTYIQQIHFSFRDILIFTCPCVSYVAEQKKPLK